jgi:hypothetical protein
LERKLKVEVEQESLEIGIKEAAEELNHRKEWVPIILFSILPLMTSFFSLLYQTERQYARNKHNLRVLAAGRQAEEALYRV